MAIEPRKDLNGDQVKRMKELAAENARLRRAVSDLTLDKMVLAAAARGDFKAPVAAHAWIVSSGSPACPNIGHPGLSVNIVP